MSCTGVAVTERPFEQDVAFLVLIQPAQTVEQGRLACTVRADQARNLA
jgi:hypothetical protein